MSKKLTLEQKRLINKEVTNEMKRCLAIVSKEINTESEKAYTVIQRMMKDIIQGSPFIKFYPELLKRIPK